MPLAPRAEALAASELGRAASELQGAAVATEAEGLRLHLSNNSNTGYKGVYYKQASGRFDAQHRVHSKDVHIGTFDTAIEAAVAYARTVGEYQPPAPPAVATEAEGFQLHLSSSGSTGYWGVCKRASSGRFEASRRVDGRNVGLGSFGTAVEAAVAYARAVRRAPAAEAGPSGAHVRAGRKRQQHRSSSHKRQRNCRCDAAGRRDAQKVCCSALGRARRSSRRRRAKTRTRTRRKRRRRTRRSKRSR